MKTIIVRELDKINPAQILFCYIGEGGDLYSETGEEILEDSEKDNLPDALNNLIDNELDLRADDWQLFVIYKDEMAELVY